MWLPYLKRTGRRFVDRRPQPACRRERSVDLTDVPVIEARGIADLDALVGPSLRAAFYVNASSGNGAFVGYQHLTHVYLGHGDSDKPPSYNPTHAMYDQIFAAGPAADPALRRPRGAASPGEVPRSSVDRRSRACSRRTRPVAEVEPAVLYAPDLAGPRRRDDALLAAARASGSSARCCDRGVTVIFRPHPFSYDFAEDVATIGRIHACWTPTTRRTGRPHRWGAAAEPELGIIDCINASDAMVSDVSSVVSDYLFSGKPFAMVAVPGRRTEFVQEYPVARASYVVRGDLADLNPRLDEMLGDDPLAATSAGDPGRLSRRLPGARLRVSLRRRRPPTASSDRRHQRDRSTGGPRPRRRESRPRSGRCPPTAAPIQVAIAACRRVVGATGPSRARIGTRPARHRAGGCVALATAERRPGGARARHRRWSV